MLGGIMGELLLKVGDRSARDEDWRDGDIICAFNRHSRRCCYAQHVCHVRRARRNGSGLIRPTEVARDWYEATHQYRFERVSQRQVRRTVILTGEVDIISRRRNDKGEHMDVPPVHTPTQAQAGSPPVRHRRPRSMVWGTKGLFGRDA